MTSEKWLLKNTASLSGKRVAVTGTTGGIGQPLCRYLATLGASLILLDRNAARSETFRAQLLEEFPTASVRCVPLQLEDAASVRAATERLKRCGVDVFIHNAGAYSIPRYRCDTGYDNVFQINFVSPYYMIRELLSTLREVGGRAVVVGSIAHRYSKSDPADVDFSKRTKASLAYGNAKRYLMFSLFELFKEERQTTLSVTHPGITFTNITAHYPKLIFALIKHPMKVLFMPSKKAALSVLCGVFLPCGYHEWIGPRLFDVWGLPQKRRLHGCGAEECAHIFRAAEAAYQNLKETERVL